MAYFKIVVEPLPCKGIIQAEDEFYAMQKLIKNLGYYVRIRLQDTSGVDLFTSVERLANPDWEH